MPRVSRYFDIEKSAPDKSRDGSGRAGAVMRVFCDGLQTLRNPLTNKGTAFTREERIALGVDGYLPPHESTLEEQIARTYRGLHKEPSPIAKYQYLRGLQDRNETLFCAVVERYIEELLPIVYTPTVGEAIQRFSRLFRTPRGLTFSTINIGRASAILNEYPLDDVRMIVCTDSSAILGIGDQGYGGIAISIGKLALYTVAGGLPPYRSLPVSLDVGTDREDLRSDPMYLGVPGERLRGEAYFAMADKFVEAVRVRYPKAIVQWEDLSKDTAFDVLARYRKRIPSFNDDIQGTGAVALAGLICAVKLQKKSLKDQVFVLHGAGAGGVGVADAIRAGLVKEGLSDADARARIFVLDSKGLLTDDRKMEEYKRSFAQPRAKLASWKTAGAVPTLFETIENARATALLGLSGQGGAFDEACVRAVANHTERPIVFPLSNPTSACEVLPKDALAWTDGRAILATGSPFDPVALPNGETRSIGQGNNAFVFPGLGFGATLAEAREVTDEMVLAGAYALAEYTEKKHLLRGWVYPPVSELREVAIRVAARVMEQAGRDKVAGRADLPADLESYVRDEAYKAGYLPVVRG